MVTVHRLRWFAPALFVLFTAGCGSYSSNPSPSAPSPSPTPAPSSATAITVPSGARTLGNLAFVPNPVTVAQGTAIMWSNVDSVAHDMVSDTGVWDSGRVGPNESFRFTFNAKGTFPYHCSIHPGMTGTIVVQ